MDDYEINRIASDNPALTAPAAQHAPVHRHRSHGRKQTTTDGSENSQKTVTSVELTKYEVRIPTPGLRLQINSDLRWVGVG
jgi:hypothetical protein